MYCPDTPDDWGMVEEKFKNKWNVPHVVAALDGKNITMKKPKKSGNEYYNYKGFFSLVLLALVDAEFRFCGSSGYCSDSQIFDRSDLWEEIENGTFRLLASEVMDGETLQPKTIHMGRKK